MVFCFRSNVFSQLVPFCTFLDARETSLPVPTTYVSSSHDHYQSPHESDLSSKGNEFLNLSSLEISIVCHLLARRISISLWLSYLRRYLWGVSATHSHLAVLNGWLWYTRSLSPFLSTSLYTNYPTTGDKHISRC